MPFDGVMPVGNARSMGQRPGRITRGVGSNRPRIHLVSTGMKVPANVYAEAVAARQARMQAEVNKLVNPSGAHASKTSPGVHYANEGRVTPGVKPHFKPARPSGGVS